MSCLNGEIFHKCICQLIYYFVHAKTIALIMIIGGGQDNYASVLVFNMRRECLVTNFTFLKGN